jgi:hypothetical protein
MRRDQTFLRIIIRGAWLIFAILLASTTPPKRPEPKVETISEVKEEEATERAFNALFWILLISLVAVIILGYLARRAAAI